MSKYREAVESSFRLLKELIAIPSFSREEKEVSDTIFSYLSERQCKIERIGNNIIAYSNNFSADKPAVLLNAHIDTVKPVAGWVHDPFFPTEEGGKLYGLGSNDCGGGLVSLLHVFLLLKDSRDDLIFVASCEEEVSGQNGISMVLPHLPQIAYAIVGEPTGMNPAIAEKGLMVVDAVSHGESGHAARNEGKNAIYIAMEDIDWLRSHHFAKNSDLLGEVKATVTIINAGTQHNVIPDQCTFVIDIRSNECYTNQEIFGILKKNMKSELKARSFRLNPSSISKEHPIVAKCIKRGRKPFGSPTLSDMALMPFPSLKLGPGASSRSHTADEYIFLDEIEEAMEIYMEII